MFMEFSALTVRYTAEVRRNSSLLALPNKEDIQSDKQTIKQTKRTKNQTLVPSRIQVINTKPYYIEKSNFPK